MTGIQNFYNTKKGIQNQRGGKGRGRGERENRERGEIPPTWGQEGRNLKMKGKNWQMRRQERAEEVRERQKVPWLASYIKTMGWVGLFVFFFNYIMFPLQKS